MARRWTESEGTAVRMAVVLDWEGSWLQWRGANRIGDPVGWLRCFHGRRSAFRMALGVK